MEASRNQFVEKGGMTDRVKSFREIDSRQDRPRWTEKGTEFDLVQTVQGGNRPGMEREWN